MKEFISAVREADAEETEDATGIEFKLDGRKMVARRPTSGQLTFLLATMGRGAGSSTSRAASIINLMMSTLQEEDADYFESRLLDPDPKTRLEPDKLEEIFEFLMEEWFGRPTQEPSDSAKSSSPDSQN